MYQVYVDHTSTRELLDYDSYTSTAVLILQQYNTTAAAYRVPVSESTS